MAIPTRKVPLRSPKPTQPIKPDKKDSSVKLPKLSLRESLPKKAPQAEVHSYLKGVYLTEYSQGDPGYLSIVRLMAQQGTAVEPILGEVVESKMTSFIESVIRRIEEVGVSAEHSSSPEQVPPEELPLTKKVKGPEVRIL